MKGIILAGGNGSRLHPITKVVSKQLLPVYDRPMIFYPIQTLIDSGIKDIMIITKKEDKELFEKVIVGMFDVNFVFEIQEEPNGIAEAFLIGEEFIGDDDVTLILGDNIFIGDGMKELISNGIENLEDGCATIFGTIVDDPKRYGVVSFTKDWDIETIEEKPKKPKSDIAVTGLYIYPPDVVNICKNLKPSKRGELEITDVNKVYCESKGLRIEVLGDYIKWFDAGTHDSLLEVSNYVNDK